MSSEVPHMANEANAKKRIKKELEMPRARDTNSRETKARSAEATGTEPKRQCQNTQVKSANKGTQHTTTRWSAKHEGKAQH